jgi:hypothetical protein
MYVIHEKILVVNIFSFLCYPIMCLYVLSSMSWCPLRFPDKKVFINLIFSISLEYELERLVAVLQVKFDFDIDVFIMVLNTRRRSTKQKNITQYILTTYILSRHSNDDSINLWSKSIMWSYLCYGKDVYTSLVTDKTDKSWQTRTQNWFQIVFLK